MCGISACISPEDVVGDVQKSLESLEYRGYDSCGLCVVSSVGIHCVRSLGGVQNQIPLVHEQEMRGTTVLAHTRWATHGKPTIANAHPHVSGDLFAVVHNGIIENAEEMRAYLQTQGYIFLSETDTEVIVHLLHFLYTIEKIQHSTELGTIIRQRLKGRYSFVAACTEKSKELLVVCQGSPQQIGETQTKAKYVVSDYIALGDLACIQYCSQDLGDVLVLHIDDVPDKMMKPYIQDNSTTSTTATANTHAHFMLQEIYQEPAVVQRELDNFLKLPLPTSKNVYLYGCGSSYYAASVGSVVLRSLFPQVTVVLAHTIDRISQKDDLHIFLSQSGETADVLELLPSITTPEQCVVISNAPHSSLCKWADQYNAHKLLLQAGIERSVASTKTFLAQQTVLYSIAAQTQLHRIPSMLDTILTDDTVHKFIHTTAATLRTASSMFLLCSLDQLPVAQEIALKFKEIAYIHAEAVIRGELKHGPLALLTEGFPVQALGSARDTKLALALSECKARGAHTLLIQTSDEISQTPENQITLTIQSPEHQAPFPITTLGHLLAYHTALLRGNSIDRPRNLAKAVTVK